MATDEEIQCVADAMQKEYRHQLPYRSLAREAITALRAMDREKATAKAAWFNHNLVGHWGPGKPRDDSPTGT